MFFILFFFFFVVAYLCYKQQSIINNKFILFSHNWVNIDDSVSIKLVNDTIMQTYVKNNKQYPFSTFCKIFNNAAIVHENFMNIDGEIFFYSIENINFLPMLIINKKGEPSCFSSYMMSGTDTSQLLSANQKLSDNEIFTFFCNQSFNSPKGFLNKNILNILDIDTNFYRVKRYSEHIQKYSLDNSGKMVKGLNNYSLYNKNGTDSICLTISDDKMLCNISASFNKKEIAMNYVNKFNHLFGNSKKYTYEDPPSYVYTWNYYEQEYIKIYVYFNEFKNTYGLVVSDEKYLSIYQHRGLLYLISSFKEPLPRRWRRN